MIRGLYNVQVMLYDHHGISALRKPLEDLDELVDIREMKPRRRLVQDIDSLSGASFAQLGGKLYPLCLPSRKGRGWLAQPYIGKAHVIQCLYLIPYPGYILKVGKSLFHGHVQHVRNVLVLIPDLQGLPVISFSVAHLTGHIYVRQEMHFDLYDPVSGTGFAPSSLYVKGKPALAVASGPCLGRRCKQIPDLVEDPRVGGGIGAGRPSYG